MVPKLPFTCTCHEGEIIPGKRVYTAVPQGLAARCMSSEPAERPTFVEILDILREELRARSYGRGGTNGSPDSLGDSATS